MAYGFQSTNASGETVIDDENPIIVQFASATIAANRIIGGKYQYDPGYNNLAAPDELIVFKIPIGSRINIFADKVGGQPNIGAIASNLSTLTYGLMKPRNLLPAPTGYGLAVYDAEGDTMWDSESSLCSVLTGGYIPANQVQNTNSWEVVINTTANAVFVTGGLIEVSFSNFSYQWATFAERISSTQWRIKQFSKGSGSGGDTTYFIMPINYMFANIA